jgi:hypothetical protein
MLVPFVDFNSSWFRCYSRAILADDSRARRRFVKAALNAVDETLRQPGLKGEEREAICAVARELRTIERQGCQIATE